MIRYQDTLRAGGDELLALAARSKAEHHGSARADVVAGVSFRQLGPASGSWVRLGPGVSFSAVQKLFRAALPWCGHGHDANSEEAWVVETNPKVCGHWKHVVRQYPLPDQWPAHAKQRLPTKECVRRQSAIAPVILAAAQPHALTNARVMRKIKNHKLTALPDNGPESTFGAISVTHARRSDPGDLVCPSVRVELHCRDTSSVLLDSKSDQSSYTPMLPRVQASEERNQARLVLARFSV